MPVNLKRFLALEFVLTLGILHAVLNATLLAVPHWRNTWGAVWAITGFIFTFPRRLLMGCKGKVLPIKNKSKCRGRVHLYTFAERRGRINPCPFAEKRAGVNPAPTIIIY